MNYTIVAIPHEKDLILLNNLRNYIYTNNFRFKNKPLGSDTHITLANISINENQIEKLRDTLEGNNNHLRKFTLTRNEWILTKENKTPNYKINKPYTWIALKFPQRKQIYEQLDKITKDLGVNNNEEYIKNVKSIAGKLEEGEYIANHINLSNYSKREKAEKCWEYFKKHLPDKITFDRVALRDESGKLVFKVKLEN